MSVLGAAGGIGQPLSLLLKMNQRVTDLALYDIRGGPGMYKNLLACCANLQFIGNGYANAMQ